MRRIALPVVLLAAVGPSLWQPAVRAESPFKLDLPKCAVSDRVSVTRGIGPNQRETWAELDGPGCIKHIWITLKHPKHSEMANRKIVMRIYFDDATVPHVEAPVGDFFGVMHGVDWYDVNTPFLSVKAWSGYNSYFEMPFAKRARIEFETGPEANHVYMQIDWHRYPDRQMKEDRRFCARWRRENPTERYGEDFFMLDADGPGQLVGFVYGVRLIDNVDRWSHGGSENVYIDGDGRHPAYLRGIGGEDTFGTSYGGAQHPPETHYYAAMPYYVHEDTILDAPQDMTARLRLAWDDRLVLRVNDQPPIDMGQHDFFRQKVASVELKKGPNCVMVKLSNTRGLNHGGWTFAFQANGPDGEILLPRVAEPR